MKMYIGEESLHAPLNHETPTKRDYFHQEGALGSVVPRRSTSIDPIMRADIEALVATINDGTVLLPAINNVGRICYSRR